VGNKKTLPTLHLNKHGKIFGKNVGNKKTLPTLH